MFICTSAKQKDSPCPKPSIIPSPSLWSFPLHLVRAFSPKAVALTFPLLHSCYWTRSYLTCRCGYTISGWWCQWCLGPHPWKQHLKSYPRWSRNDPKHGWMGFQMLCVFPGYSWCTWESCCLLWQMRLSRKVKAFSTPRGSLDANVVSPALLTLFLVTVFSVCS